MTPKCILEANKRCLEGLECLVGLGSLAGLKTLKVLELLMRSKKSEGVRRRALLASE